MCLGAVLVVAGVKECELNHSHWVERRCSDVVEEQVTYFGLDDCTVR